MQQQPLDVLKKYWGHDTFRGQQEAIINTALSGRDSLTLMPTGGGKSLCFQVPAMCLEGICIVVSPLVALINNQVNTLKDKGIKAIALTGGKSQEEILDLLDNCLYGNYKFLYLSPERLQQELIQEKIKEMPVNLIAIDEAHCISEWGHDFRPAYLDCNILRELVPQAPFMALTATATKATQKDINHLLQLCNPAIFKDSFSRRNITFKVLRNEDKHLRLIPLCQRTTESIIVYVRSRKMCKQLAQTLEKNGFTVAFYHGGLSSYEKEKSLHSWMQNKSQIMVATNAFGMGIDKADVRLVIHYQIPDSLESYYQEAGRAGRDGKAAAAVLLLGSNDIQKAEQQFIDSLPDSNYLKQLYRTLNNYFQISYGELSTRLYQFKFTEFCQRYHLASTITYNGLRLLDQHGVLSLTTSFATKTSIQFIASKNEIFSYLDKQETWAASIQLILRTYGGVFENETKINTHLIAKKAGVSEENIKVLLTQMAKDGIIHYIAKHSDAEIFFTVPREDDRTINTFAHTIKKHQEAKYLKFKAMIDYLLNTKICRQQQILSYFGEDTSDVCGVCDFCKANSPQKTSLQIKERILYIVTIEPFSSVEIIELTKLPENLVLESIKELLEENKIKINPTNKYIKV